MKLNKEQTEAVNILDGNLLIVASAGTGKTTTIVERYANMVNCLGKDPNRILMTTFTNKAAKDMIAKIASRTNRLPLWIGTMHSLFLRILRQNAGVVLKSLDFTLITEDIEKKKIIRGLLLKEKIKASPEEIEYIMKKISEFKSKGIHADSLKYEEEPEIPKEKKEDIFEDEVMYIAPDIENKIILFYKMYQEFMKKKNLLDFDDILLYTLEIFEKKPEILNSYASMFSSIMVDEAQDLNVVQIKILDLLARNNLCLIGDDCQNIYEWRGSSNKLVFHFDQNHKKIVLEDNYRSTENIIGAVNNVIKNMRFKIDKKLRCTRDKGERIKIEGFESFDEEICYIIGKVKEIKKKTPLHEIAVLSRTNYIGKKIEREFLRNRIPCHLSKSRGLLEREEVKDIISFLNFKVNPFSSIDFERVIGLFPGVGKVTITKIIFAADKKNLNYASILKEIEKVSANDSVKFAAKKILAAIESKDHPILSFLTNFQYEQMLEKKYFDETLKLEDKMENIKLLSDLYIGFSFDSIGIRDFLDSLIEIDKKDKDSDKVKISTIHAAKGLEWKHVFLACCNEKILPYYKKSLTDLKRDAELRLFYVAISRAKDNLYITYSMKQGWQMLFPSQFLDII